MDEKTAALLTEQLRHANTLLQARIRTLEARLTHSQVLNNQRLSLLETQMRDHETRLRAATEGVTQFKLFSGLASGGSGLMSLAAILKAFLGG
jgi:alpha-D-ribose 1-methylphosphonate 5-phosphate C-P lyase